MKLPSIYIFIYQVSSITI